jgi:hypothetical protein
MKRKKLQDRRTGQEAASLAAKLLRDPTASAEVKSVAASDLAQWGTPKQTSAEDASLAGRLLRGSKDSAVKSVAGSDLSQRAPLPPD